jgi:hypothetical protein
VSCKTNVIDDVSTLLAATGPVDASNGLKQIVSNHLAVEVHDLFDRRIEAGNEHVVHNQNR